MKRSKHSLSHYHLFTCDAGKLIPCAVFEVLPGDSVQQSTSLLVRASPLIAPLMHPVVVRVHHWFVPNRIVWEGWEDFITGGPDGQGGSAGAYPTISPSVINRGDLSDYMGVPPQTGPGITFGDLALRAYQMIWREFYRDQDLESEDAGNLGALRMISWEKDYFTSARPWPQKGLDVSLPLGSVAPVVPSGDKVPIFEAPGMPATAGLATKASQQYLSLFGAGNASSEQGVMWSQTKLQADLTNATATNVNAVRLAFALQRYQEARARYGSRYTEYLRYLGVRSSDARLQRPEYLGGGKQTISFSEVLQTGPGVTPGSPVPGGVGQMAGHGIAAMRSRRYRRFFEEHGHVISLLSIRPKAIYSQSVDKLFLRRTKEEYWQKELEQIGQQEVNNLEVFGKAGTSGRFGYQDRYAEYKHKQSRVSAEFRDLMNYWHWARSFSATPVLNSSFVQCDPGKRVFAEQTKHSFWVMASHSIQARRMVSKSSSSRIM